MGKPAHFDQMVQAAAEAAARAREAGASYDIIKRSAASAALEVDAKYPHTDLTPPPPVEDPRQVRMEREVPVPDDDVPF